MLSLNFRDISCVLSLKFKNLKANHNTTQFDVRRRVRCVLSLKFKNLKANHNTLSKRYYWK